jgi:chaperonin cofactor prefoldin
VRAGIPARVSCAFATCTFEVANCDLKEPGEGKLSFRMPGREEPIESRILVLRRHKVILDTDLAELYGVSVKRLNEQVKRNRDRFPPDFMFRLSAKEYEVLRSQSATSKTGRGGRRFLPYAFTEHGAIMAATVLNSQSAIAMSLFVVRAFVRMRELLAQNRQIAAKIEQLENRLDKHDTDLQEIVEAIKELMIPLEGSGAKIGFQLPGKRQD